MHPSIVNSANEMAVSSSYLVNNSNPNPNLISTHVTNHYSQPNLTSTSPLNYMNLFHTWNYHQYLTSSASSSASLKPNPLSDNSLTDCQSHNSSFHQYYPRLLEKSCSSTKKDDEYNILEKFHHDTLVNLDTGEGKNIQQLTTNDFLNSAKQNQQYSSLLARIDYIGTVDKATGKVELRFYIDEIDKTTSYYVLQEMPFFVYQYSCWSSVSPEYTHRICGLKCRQLECGDIIIAVTEQRKNLSTKLKDKPDYRQQSPTKSLVGRYMNTQISSSSSNKRHKISNE